MKVVIAGGTGFLGQALVIEFLKRDYSILLLTRHPEKIIPQPQVSAFSWLSPDSPPLENLLEGTDILINLAGAPLMKSKWTRGRKEKIISSRIQSTQAIIQALPKVHNRPRVFINASAVGWYGHRTFGEVTESAPKGSGFLSQVCESWEQESRQASELEIRTIQARFGIIIASNGGFLRSLIPLFKWFLGGYPGDGSQWFSWIHLQDALNAILFICDTPSLEGPVNITSPDPIQMKSFSKLLGKTLKRPSLIPIPAWILRWLLQDMSEALLAGAKVIPEKLIEAQFQFIHPTLQEALKTTLSHAKQNQA